MKRLATQILKKAIVRKVGNYKQDDEKVWKMWSICYPDTKRHIIEEFAKVLKRNYELISNT
jgi:hypothetical protein